MISATLLMAPGAEGNTDNPNIHSLSRNPNECKICHEAFGKIINRPIICFKCKEYVCSIHSSQQRYNYKKRRMELVCDECIGNEHKITIRIKLRNLKLKYRRHEGTYINKIDPNSKEYKQYGLRNRAKIIMIRDKNVESFNGQIIANTLNTIDIPFDLTLDFSKCNENEWNKSPKLPRRHTIDRTIGYGAPISDKEMEQILKAMLAKEQSVMYI